MTGYVPLQHRGLPDMAVDGDHIDSGSIRPDRRARVTGSAIVGHRTRESFMRATGKSSSRERREPAPIPDGYSAREAREGLRAIYSAAIEHAKGSAA